ncbi:E3 ubiquitin-protein ligase TRIM71 [Lonchura striata]|uniref:E3 ubiquitin-protein ligase TRIM71 n=1 Tax=Lonchura striata TaxID=40157 RepID=A0A218UUA5_9PASE|nr:E3 ubiquitin-protein ligase TRIM71 [Lonchura striata domestica]
MASFPDSSGGGGGSSCGGPPRRLHRHPGAGDALKLRCPICDQKVVISEPSGMDALPSSNFLLSNLLDVVVVAAAADEQKNGRAAGAGPAAGSGGGGGGNNRHHGRPPPGPPRAAGSSPAAAASAAPSSTSSSSSSSGGGGGSAALLLRRPHSRQGEPRCSSCDEGNAASSRCLDCQEHLCDNCVRAHQRVRLTKDHFIERFAAGPAAAGPAAPLALSPPYPASPYNILSVFPDRASYCQHHDDENMILLSQYCYSSVIFHPVLVWSFHPSFWESLSIPHNFPSFHLCFETPSRGFGIDLDYSELNSREHEQKDDFFSPVNPPQTK